MTIYQSYEYKAELADISKDGKQVRLYRETTDPYRPNQRTELTTIDMEHAKELRDSLNEVIE